MALYRVRRFENEKSFDLLSYYFLMLPIRTRITGRLLLQRVSKRAQIAFAGTIQSRLSQRKWQPENRCPREESADSLPNVLYLVVYLANDPASLRVVLEE